MAVHHGRLKKHQHSACQHHYCTSIFRYWSINSPSASGEDLPWSTGEGVFFLTGVHPLGPDLKNKRWRIVEVVNLLPFSCPVEQVATWYFQVDHCLEDFCFPYFGLTLRDIINLPGTWEQAWTYHFKKIFWSWKTATFDVCTNVDLSICWMATLL